MSTKGASTTADAMIAAAQRMQFAMKGFRFIATSNVEKICRLTNWLEPGRLEPEVSDTSSIPWQVLEFVQSIEVVDREVSDWFGFRQA